MNYITPRNISVGDKTDFLFGYSLVPATGKGELGSSTGHPAMKKTGTNADKAAFSPDFNQYYTKLDRQIPEDWMVVDIDVKHANGYDPYTVLLCYHLPEPNAFCFTQSGGMHFYYKLPEGSCGRDFYAKHTLCEQVENKVVRITAFKKNLKGNAPVPEGVRRLVAERYGWSIDYDTNPAYAIYNIRDDVNITKEFLDRYFNPIYKNAFHNFIKAVTAKNGRVYLPNKEEWNKVCYAFRDWDEYWKEPFLLWTSITDSIYAPKKEEDYTTGNLQRWENPKLNTLEDEDVKGDKQNIITCNYLKDNYDVSQASDKDWGQRLNENTMFFVNPEHKASLIKYFGLPEDGEIVDNYSSAVAVFDGGNEGVKYLYTIRGESRETPMKNVVQALGDVKILVPGEQKHPMSFFERMKPYQKVYIKKGIVFDGQECEHTLNLLPASQFKPEITNLKRDRRTWEEFQDFVLNLAEADTEAYKWLNAWLTICIVGLRKGVRPMTAVSLTGPSGTGKSTISQIITAFTGGPTFTTILTADRQRKDNYASYLRNKLFINCAEANFSDDKMFKEWITGDTYDTNGKWKEDENTKLHFAMMFTSNDDNPIPIDETNRRVASFEPTIKYKKTPENTEELDKFFSKLHPLSMAKTPNPGYEETMNALLYFYSIQYEENKDDYLRFLTSQLPVTKSSRRINYYSKCQIHKAILGVTRLNDVFENEAYEARYSEIKSAVLSSNRNLKERELVQFLLKRKLMITSPGESGDDPMIRIPEKF
jgi:hypothetical protein